MPRGAGRRRRGGETCKGWQSVAGRRHMHMHVYSAMRTTIELKDEHRARLLELAARRREKGFSGIVAEAVEVYLRALDADASAREEALRQRASLPAAEAERLRSQVSVLRESWR